MGKTGSIAFKSNHKSAWCCKHQINGYEMKKNNIVIKLNSSKHDFEN